MIIIIINIINNIMMIIIIVIMIVIIVIIIIIITIINNNYDYLMWWLPSVLLLWLKYINYCYHCYYYYAAKWIMDDGWNNIYSKCLIVDDSGCSLIMFAIQWCVLIIVISDLYRSAER